MVKQQLQEGQGKSVKQCVHIVLFFFFHVQKHVRFKVFALDYGKKLSIYEMDHNSHWWVNMCNVAYKIVWLKLFTNSQELAGAHSEHNHELQEALQSEGNAKS